MRKFYFLDTSGQWKGPYLFPAILFFTLTGRIQPSTYLWHDKLAKDVGKHPIESIYARKAAHEYRFLPVWIFASNLHVIAINAWRQLRRLLKSKDDWESFVKTPIEIDFAIKESIPAYLMPSITAINDFASPRDYKVKLTYLNKDDEEKVTEYPIEIRRASKVGVYFEITMDEPPVVGGVMHQESYGLDRQLLLVGKKRKIAVEKNSVFDFSTRFPFKPQILKGRFRQASTDCSNNYQNCYNRLIIKVDDDKIVGPQEILDSTGRHFYDNEYLNTDATPMGISFRTGSTFAEFMIAGVRYKFYTLKGNLLVIDGTDREDLSLFKQKAQIARVVLSLMSGKFYGGECFYVSSEEPTFREIAGVWYEMEKESVISNRRVVDLRFFRATFRGKDKDIPDEYKTLDRPVETTLFSNLCDTFLKDESLFHAANLVISGMGNADPLQQGALYSVALEALTNTLGEQKTKELKPITDPKVSKAFVSQLQEVLARHKEKISQDGYVILGKNIEGINRPTNRDKLVKTFELFGIKLSEEDKETINKRNDYLHGRNPLAPQEIFELTKMSLRLHTLIVGLLLKSAGYAGHVINLDTFIYLKDEERLKGFLAEIGKRLSEPFRELQQALKDNDTARAKELMSQLDSSLNHYKLRAFIRVV